MEAEKEAELGIGLVRNEEYIGFYLNLTAWNINATANVIQLSLRKGSKILSSIVFRQIILLNKGIKESVLNPFSSKRNEDGSVQAGTHLIIMDDSPCQDTAARSSNPAILNYYRQFLIKGSD